MIASQNTKHCTDHTATNGIHETGDSDSGHDYETDDDCDQAAVPAGSYMYSHVLMIYHLQCAVFYKEDPSSSPNDNEQAQQDAADISSFKANTAPLNASNVVEPNWNLFALVCTHSMIALNMYII